MKHCPPILFQWWKNSIFIFIRCSCLWLRHLSRDICLVIPPTLHFANYTSCVFVPQNHDACLFPTVTMRVCSTQSRCVFVPQSRCVFVPHSHDACLFPSHHECLFPTVTKVLLHLLMQLVLCLIKHWSHLWKRKSLWIIWTKRFWQVSI